MLPKNSRRPLTLDHKIRLKKQRAKALKAAGFTENDGPSDASIRPHQNFKPRPENKIIKQLQSEQDEQMKLREVTLFKIHNISYIINIIYI